MEIIAKSEAYLLQLQLFIEPKDKLRQHGFVTQPLTDEELILKRRCLGCGKSMSQLKGKKGPGPPRTRETRSGSNDTSLFTSTVKAPLQLSDPAKPKAAPQFKCKFHTGEVFQKYWTCCKQHCSADPCSGADFHDPSNESIQSLTQHHQFHMTPVALGRSGPRDIRAAVALDCEMGTAESGDSELIKITLIDYFTGEILLNNIVEPDVPMRHLNTRYSGVTWGQMRAAQRKRTSLNATAGARAALWKYVGDQTIVIGHGVGNDLRAMKWIHEFMVDSMIVESNIKKLKEEKEKKAKEEAIAKAKAEGTYVEPVEVSLTPGMVVDGAAMPTQKKQRRKGGDLSLKSLADVRLGRKIQLGDGKTGHDSLEDAIAARDLIHWHISNPDLASE